MRRRALIASLAAAALALAACSTAADGGVAGDRIASPSPTQTTMNTSSPRDPALLPLVIAAGLPDCPDSDPSLAPIEPVGALGGGLPDLTFACLGEGPDVTLSGLRGTPLIINVWASWCPPCIIEMPLLAEAARTYADDLIMLGIDMQIAPRPPSTSQPRSIWGSPPSSINPVRCEPHSPSPARR
jgi:Thiol-disulfide isomerase and thioredoxins